MYFHVGSPCWFRVCSLHISPVLCYTSIVVLSFIILCAFVKLHLPRMNSSLGSRCIKFRACQMWKALPLQLKEISQIKMFKEQLTKFLFSTD